MNRDRVMKFKSMNVENSKDYFIQLKNINKIYRVIKWYDYDWGNKTDTINSYLCYNREYNSVKDVAGQEQTDLLRLLEEEDII